MPPKPRPVTAKALQGLLTRIGSASSGTKDVLQERFRRDLRQPRLPALKPQGRARQELSWGRKLRVFSIDMGIKNLAYCHVEIDYANGNPMNPTIDIISWDKLNLADAPQDLRPPLQRPRIVEEDAADAEEEIDPYSLNVLSQTAVSFVRKTVLQHTPDIILIERQRWRSAGGAAIQQWTVRVNTLEAMLWSALETMRVEHGNASSRFGDTQRQDRNYQVYGVDPKRVGQFWLGQHARAKSEEHEEAVLALAQDELQNEGTKGASVKKVPRSKAEKSAKIALLRSWLTTEPASTASSTPDSTPVISFTIGAGATTARDALCLPANARRSRKKAKSGDEAGEAAAGTTKDVKKLDDITDCCLQAAAWVAWEANRLQLYNVWERETGRAGKMPDLDDNVFKAMLAATGQG
ncbi:hypothetical protein ACEQ8H_001553 [Pleosporales sp. CAS-2024a]